LFSRCFKSPAHWPRTQVDPLHVGADIAMLCVSRLIAGTFGSSPLANAGGTLADIWKVPLRAYLTNDSPTNEERQCHSLQRRPSSDQFSVPSWEVSYPNTVRTRLFKLIVVSWRWTFWVSLIFASIMFADMVFILPETYTKAILEKKARRLRKETGNVALYSASEKKKQTMFQLYKVSLSRPWRMFLEPIVLLFSIYVAILYGILYLLFVAFPIIFERTTSSFVIDSRTTWMECGNWWFGFHWHRNW